MLRVVQHRPGPRASADTRPRRRLRGLRRAGRASGPASIAVSGARYFFGGAVSHQNGFGSVFATGQIVSSVSAS